MRPSYVPILDESPEPCASAALLPTTVPGWIPFLWKRVLFPGWRPDAEPAGWKPFVLVALLAGALLYPCLAFPLFEPDEGRYAQIPREMLESGDWVVPTLQGQPYLDKPPLFYWLVMAAYALFGYHDWAARLIPALAVHATVLLTYVLGRRLIGARAALWGALLLTVTPAFLGMGRLLLLDGLLTFWVTLALFAGYLAQRPSRLAWSWWLTAALACGLGVLTKGPIAVVLVLVPLLAHRRLMNAPALGWRPWLALAAIVLAVASPWYIAICQTSDFARHFLLQHNVMRFMQPFDHDRPVWFYVPVLIVGLLPVTLLTPWWSRFLLAGDDDTARRRCPELGYLLLASGWCVFFFSLAGCKLPTYILPAIVPLCLAIGYCIVATGLHHSRKVWVLLAGHALLLAAGQYLLVPWYAAERSPLSQPDVVACCGDPSVPVVCFPRNIDSVAFYVGRSDFHSFRSKQLPQLLDFLDEHPRVVILFGHRNSIDTLKRHLPPHLHYALTRPLAQCDMAVVERDGSERRQQARRP